MAGFLFSKFLVPRINSVKKGLSYYCLFSVFSYNSLYAKTISKNYINLDDIYIFVYLYSLKTGERQEKDSKRQYKDTVYISFFSQILLVVS